MRAWLFLLLFSAGLSAATALPAAANNVTVHGQPVVAGAPSPHAQMPRHFVLRHHRKPAHSFNRFSPFGVVQPVPVLLDGLSGVDTPDAADNGAPMVIVTPDSSDFQRGSRAALDQRPTVETTPSGVVIVRGPGSRHLDR